MSNIIARTEWAREQNQRGRGWLRGAYTSVSETKFSIDDGVVAFTRYTNEGERPNYLLIPGYLRTGEAIGASRMKRFRERGPVPNLSVIHYPRSVRERVTPVEMAKAVGEIQEKVEFEFSVINAISLGGLVLSEIVKQNASPGAGAFILETPIFDWHSIWPFWLPMFGWQGAVGEDSLFVPGAWIFRNIMRARIDDNSCSGTGSGLLILSRKDRLLRNGSTRITAGRMFSEGKVTVVEVLGTGLARHQLLDYRAAGDMEERFVAKCFG